MNDNDSKRDLICILFEATIVDVPERKKAGEGSVSGWESASEPLGILKSLWKIDDRIKVRKRSLLERRTINHKS